MFNFTPQELNNQDLKRKEDQFQKIVDDRETADQVFDQLHSFFRGKKPETDFKYYHSYFRWYTELSWQYLRSRDRNFLSNIAVGRQIFLASFLGYDVTDRLLNYLKTRPVNENETQSLFHDIEQNLNNSSEIIYKEDDKTFLVSDLFSEFDSIRNKEDVSLERAKLYTKIRDNVSDQKWFEYAFVDFDESLDKMIELYSFVESVEVDDIYYTVDAYFFPEKYKEDPTNPEAAKEDSSSPSDQEQQKTVETTSNKTDEKKGSESEDISEVGMDKNEETSSEKTKSDQTNQNQKNDEINNTEEKANQNYQKEKDEPKQNKNKKDNVSNETTQEKKVADILEDTEVTERKDKNAQDKQKNDESALSDQESIPKKDGGDSKDDKKNKDESPKDSNAKKAKEKMKQHQGLDDQQIKQEAEEQFGNIEELDPEQIDSFKRVLKNIAKQEDREEEVEDWFYFDPDSESFQWNL
ncbi:MAG: hypothetical protein ABEJ24_01910 [Candidatus Magasanikbacteria bacterium]